MANTLYNPARAKFANSGTVGTDATDSIRLVTDDIRAALVKTGFSFTAANEFYSTISSNVHGTPVALSSKDATDGIYSAASTVFTSVASGQTIIGVLLYKQTANANTTWSLVCSIDTASGGAISITTNDGNITIAWATTGNKIFKL